MTSTSKYNLIYSHLASAKHLPNCDFLLKALLPKVMKLCAAIFGIFNTFTKIIKITEKNNVTSKHQEIK